jgi:LPXTG-motif cell wall-anchored protein
MKKILRTAAAATAFGVVGLGLAGVASAAEPEYVPAEVEGSTQTNTPAVEAAATTTGALPYTGNDSSLPLAEAGVALLAGGGALLLVVKRRQANA